LLFMGEEYGETNPFQYFVSHGDPDLIEAVRAGRRREFAAFAWPGDGADPQAETTFERSRLCWERREQPRHRQMLCLYRDLLALRRSEPVLCPGGARVAVACDEDDDVIEIRYRAGERVLCAWFNCSTAAVTVDLNEKELDGLTLALATDGTAYGGAGDTRLDGRPGGSRLELAPWTAAVLRGAGGN
jgi:maltooligosyltrehalose trehalohydrolase